MINNSIKNLILEFLKQQKDWVYGGVIEDYIRATHGSKASCISRRCRELYNDGLIDRRFTRVEGAGNVVQYKIIVEPVIEMPEKWAFRKEVPIPAQPLFN